MISPDDLLEAVLFPFDTINPTEKDGLTHPFLFRRDDSVLQRAQFKFDRHTHHRIRREWCKMPLLYCF